ncbi:hypothetical protein EHI8A_005160 [Entamoeba histolytica HM-1:IMSS-B]|uniref:Ku domain-containing protein n=6 Tax=Entamoeba histolytica TaxID=5759 RepID=C4LZ44_ENTH1|nr:hypothetical protein EHI_009700 [Entamoeba histolytica HM-1:IMSS]EMD44539.1 Hypothetical protein EHI5A_215830 [Entamoeba histolytica KU27]EMH74750.1 hypothetical protein EHI8A_005160 [Entamoeba histolytica HM-1:IMSS-B]EMS12766.1 hypothetical protein KM1_019600 [Entamoeba histolytica HM-3:IMSS]ENY62282.1 hypothetical protein EHI7A_008040 [Entamoeba histolytica HM-1:IMSS-A]GAT94117.1 hypothetical protein CL6EHI_009700 [Entamoeba histolytica]|eukprot:XP_654683.1 hypothetical protein EHI_009700 [Entamoeba histolytica HM-1:IMSS]
MNNPTHPSLDLNEDKRPFKNPVSKPCYKYALTLIKDIEIFVDMYKQYEVQKFPRMSHITPFRKVPDYELPVEKRKKYYVLKSDPNNSGAQFGEEDVVKTLRYGKSLLRPAGLSSASKIDGVETMLGRDKVLQKREREFHLYSFVPKDSIPIIYFQENSWIIKPCHGFEEIYTCLNNMMLEQKVVGIARFVLIKSYCVRNLIVIPTADGLIAREIPWGSTFVADGLSVESQSSTDQQEWMSRWLNELPRREDGLKNNPLLDRLWNNVFSRQNNGEWKGLLPIEEQPTLSDELKESAQELLNWNIGLEYDD